MKTGLLEGSIKAYFNSTIAEIREHDVDVQTPEGIVTIENDWVLSMTGYQPNLTFLRDLGIELSNDEICTPTYSDENFETNVDGIYLAGVICGGMNTHRLFIENSREHAEKIVADINKKMKKQKLISIFLLFQLFFYISFHLLYKVTCVAMKPERSEASYDNKYQILTAGFPCVCKKL